MSLSTRLSFLAVLLLLVLSAAAVQAQTASCRPCAIAHEQCSVNCLGREGKAVGACLIRCDNAAAVCSCDEPATLNSEDFVAKFGPQPGPEPGLKVVTDFSAACNSTTPCDSSYGSCASWSSYVECGEPRCAFRVHGCGGGGYEDPPFGPGTLQDLERYRVCFNSQAEACTEYQRTTWTLWCGC